MASTEPVQSPEGVGNSVPVAESSSSPAGAAAASGQPGDVLVFNPPSSSSEPAPVDDSFFEPTLSDVQMYQASVSAKSKRLNDAPFLTAKHRDAVAAEKEKKKADKWPTATIRVKFSDGTQIQREFPSTSPIQPVYDFVRESLSASAREQVFTLYQPPRTLYPEKPVPVPAAPKHINPAMKAHVVQPAGYNSRGTAMQGGTGGNESLSQLGLVPQSVLLLKWEDASLNVSDAPAPLTDELRAKAAPLPAAAPKQETTTDSSKLKKLTGGTGDVKMPKWLQKGLMKKK